MHVLMVVLLVMSARCEDFCSTNTYTPPRQDKRLTFSKELSDIEYAEVGSFASLHCCASYFRTIEWFKDGEAYPWRPGDVSSLIINPASHNQTIYSQRMSRQDTGKYYCLVSNATHVLRHDVTLSTTDELASIGQPKATHPPRDLNRQVGEMARFYCEAYVGNINLPDAKSEIHWSRENNDNSTLLSPRIEQRTIFRGNKRIVGAYLTIDPVQAEDFGDFWCIVSNHAGDQFLKLRATLYPVEPQVVVPRMVSIEESSERDGIIRLCFFLTMIMVTLAVLIYIIIRCRLQFRIFWKNICTCFHTPGDSEVDVALIFHERDAAMALGQIVPTLRHNFHYTCSVCQYFQLSSVNSADVSSRRLMAIVTPSATGEVWNSTSIAHHLLSLLQLHPKVICLFLKELPMTESKTEDGRLLKECLSKVHYITYHETRDNNFWTIVQLGLPVHRKARRVQCRESLENLV